jgi:hypothetical protein
MTKIQVTKKAAELAERSGIDLKEVKGSGKEGRILLSDIEALIEETDEGEIIEVVDDEDDDDWGDNEGEEAEIVETDSAEDDDDDWGDEAEEVEEPKAGPEKGKYTTKAEPKEDHVPVTEEGEEYKPPFEPSKAAKKKEEKPAPKPDPKPEPKPEFSGKTHTLYFEWVSVEPDSNAYKPLKPQLSPMNAGVRIDVPEEYVMEVAKLDKENEMVFLTPEGMAYCANLLAQATLIEDNASAKDDPNPENWDSGDSDKNFDDWAGEEGLDDEDEGWDD